MSRFPAEVTITTVDGTRITECFNQAEMARFTRERMLARVQRGEVVCVFDDEEHQIPAERVASVEVYEGVEFTRGSYAPDLRA
ncbi:MAG: hypothetical protein M3R35_07585 [Candidatus Eremiobacteraeota bacterium]|nr:hypothetical protein [Candidatus Eremiobacteraeota bacterium]